MPGPAPIPRPTLRRTVGVALDEDLGRGDITTEACVPPDARGRAAIVAREPLVLSGLDVVREVFRQVDPAVSVEGVRLDGERLGPGDRAAVLEGPARALLAGERVALNFLQRMSGVATMARSLVDAVPDDRPTRIVDTRKTTPGLRAVERYAVRCGGAHNHREDLASAVLIKDNHIAAAGSVRAAVAAARERAPHTSRIECEVDGLGQLEEALQAGADVLLLDNFDDEATSEAVRRVAGRALLEASGGITRARVEALARAGVDAISVGALTHSAPAVDLGLDWIA
jgi:nicotinate-nucleotide pyrophosphorylase (carboxylating)